VALLWPAHGWPPEIDYFEMWDGNRQKDLLTNHYSSANKMQHSHVMADFTQWHTIGLEWTPQAITYLLDNKVVAVQTGHVPHQPMWMGFQTTTGAYGPGAAPSSSTPSSVAWDIDYIKAWHYNG
jgi:beta-glucanase (GH16 family)